MHQYFALNHLSMICGQAMISSGVGLVLSPSYDGLLCLAAHSTLTLAARLGSAPRHRLSLSGLHKMWARHHLQQIINKYGEQPIPSSMSEGSQIK